MATETPWRKNWKDRGSPVSALICLPMSSSRDTASYPNTPEVSIAKGTKWWLRPCSPRWSTFVPHWWQWWGWQRMTPRQSPTATLTSPSSMRRPSADIILTLIYLQLVTFSRHYLPSYCTSFTPYQWFAQFCTRPLCNMSVGVHQAFRCHSNSDHTFLSSWIGHYEVPHTITTDKRAQFESYLWAQLMRLMVSTHTRITTYHSTSDRMVSKQPHSGWEMLPLSLYWHPLMHQGRLTLHHCRAAVQHYIVPSWRMCDWSNAHTDFSHTWPIHWQCGMSTHHLSSPNITSQPSQTTHQQGFIFIYTWCSFQANASHHIMIKPFRF